VFNRITEPEKINKLINSAGGSTVEIQDSLTEL
jgi:hypothetical protein